MAKINASVVTSNMMWRFLERIGAQLVSFGVSILLARLLDPNDYGVVAIVLSIMAILQIFVDSGLGNALIQKKDVDNDDYSTVFVFNTLMCFGLYAALFFAAPLVARIYEIPQLTALIRVLGINLIVSGVRNVQQAYVSRNMMMKKFFFATLGGTIISAIAGVLAAFLGCGVWALVIQSLVNAIVGLVVLWFIVDWKPKWSFSLERFKRLFGFGWKLLFSALLDTGYNEMTNLLIGGVYSSKDLAYYTKGQQIPNLVVMNVNTSITSVLFPALSELQDDPEMVKKLTRRSMKTCSYIMWPMMLGLAACAEPLIRLLLTEKWLPAVPYMQIICLTFGMFPINVSNLEAIKAMGRSDLFLKLEIVKKIVALSLLVVALPQGVMAVALSSLISTVISTVINSFPNWKLLRYSYFEQMKDVLPPFLLSACMAAAVMQFSHIITNDILLLCVQVISGVVIYVLGSWVFRMDSFKYLLNFAKSTVLSKIKK
ncbi:MAG: lipopolysaccharide biosynthesis protein [Clostridia bacterium]|nr:lipopolysaccharide biosynthesis protein [Clostridia bacterium]